MKTFVTWTTLPSHQLPSWQSADDRTKNVISAAQRGLFRIPASHTRTVTEGEEFKERLTAAVSMAQNEAYGEHNRMHGNQLNTAATDQSCQAYVLILTQESESSPVKLVAAYCCSSNGTNMNPNIGTLNKGLIMIDEEQPHLSRESLLAVCCQVLVFRDGKYKIENGFQTTEETSTYKKYKTYNIPVIGKSTKQQAYVEESYKFDEKAASYIPKVDYKAKEMNLFDFDFTLKNDKPAPLSNPRNYEPGLDEKPRKNQKFFSVKGSEEDSIPSLDPIPGSVEGEVEGQVEGEGEVDNNGYRSLFNFTD